MTALSVERASWAAIDELTRVFDAPAAKCSEGNSPKRAW
jgi:hypothetical protein